MNTESNLRERCQKILEENGGKVADRASRILLEDPRLMDFRPPLQFISKNWRDPLTPAMMRLSCEAVGGRSEVTDEAALAMSLINLSFYVWDDIVDKAQFKLFKPSLVGEFGEGTALIIGGLASAKAFLILNQMDLDEIKRRTVTKLFWNLLTKMANAEAVSLKLRSQGNFSPREKFWKIKTEAAADLGGCLKIGAVLGDGSEGEVNHLGRYGQYFCIILEIWKDFHVSVNLTLGLAEKIRNGALPYSLRWAMNNSEKLRKKVEVIANSRIIGPSDIKEIVENMLETKALNNTIKIIKKFTRMAREGLLQLKKKNKATRTLKLLVEAQPQLFIESLSPLHVERAT